MGKASRLAERPDFSVPPTPQGRTMRFWRASGGGYLPMPNSSLRKVPEEAEEFACVDMADVFRRPLPTTLCNERKRVGRADQASSQFPRQCFRIPAVAFRT